MNETQTGHVITPIRDGVPSTWAARLWASPGRLYLSYILALAVIPAILFVLIAQHEQTFFLKGKNNGLFEDPIFLSYFPMMACLVIATHQVVRHATRTLNSLLSVVEFRTDTGDDSCPSVSRLEVKEFDAMLRWCEYVICQLSFHTPSNGVALPDSYRHRSRRLHAIWWISILGGILFTAMSTWSHLNAEARYGFQIWSSGEHLLGFGARLVYEILINIVVFPMVVYRLGASVYLMYHSLALVDSRNGLRFLRFPPDEASGLALYGSHSLRNSLAVLSFSLPIVTYFIWYPLTPALIIATVVFNIALPAVFFIPLLGARRSIIRVKQKELERLGQTYEEAYSKYKRDFGKISLKEQYTATELQVQMELIFSSIAQLPLWPVRRRTNRQLISILAGLAALVVSKIATLFVG